jgi:hypothetical protein
MKDQIIIVPQHLYFEETIEFVILGRKNNYIFDFEKPQN